MLEFIIFFVLIIVPVLKVLQEFYFILFRFSINITFAYIFICEISGVYLPCLYTIVLKIILKGLKI